MKTNINGNSGSVKQSTKKQCNANEKFRRSNDASVWGAVIMVRLHQRTDHKAGSATRRRRWTAERVRARRSRRPHPMRRRPRAAGDTARYIAVCSTMPALRGPASSSHQVILSTICLFSSLFKRLLEVYYKVEICLINMNTVSSTSFYQILIEKKGSTK